MTVRRLLPVSGQSRLSGETRHGVTPHRGRRLSAAAVALFAPLILSACGDSWFGGDTKPPLPGNRISVLQHENSLKPTQGGGPVEIRLPAPEPNEDWPQAGGYSHHSMQHMEIGAAPREDWTTSVGTGNAKRSAVMAEPVVGEGRVYAVDAQGRATALDAKRGSTLWSVDLAPDDEDDNAIIGGGIAYDDGRVFVTTAYAEVVALDAATGKEQWRQKVTAPVRAAPTINGGRVFVATLDNKGLALAADDGRILWTYSGNEEGATVLAAAAPAVDNGVVVFPFSSGEVVALRVDTGAPLWNDSIIAARRTDATGTLASIAARPVIDNNRLFVIGHSGLMVGIDMRTGDRSWDLELSGLSQPWIAGDYLFAVSVDAQLVAVDARNGKILWVTALPLWQDDEDKTGRILWTGPVLASDRLIVTGSHGEAMSVDPYTGKVIGRMDMPDGINLPPAIAGKALYFLSNNGDIVSLR